jgi:hypothetical protein
MRDLSEVLTASPQSAATSLCSRISGNIILIFQLSEVNYNVYKRCTTKQE